MTDLLTQPGLRRLTLPGAPESPLDIAPEPSKPASAASIISTMASTVKREPRATVTQPVAYGPDMWERYATPQDVPVDDFFPFPSYRKYQRETIVDIITALFPVEKGGKGKRFCIFEGGTGCHAKGTKILMSDGTLKRVEDIVVGDAVMGPDSKPRQVLALHRGRETMARIIPTKGEPFVVNLGHVLSLQMTNKSQYKRPWYCLRSKRKLKPFRANPVDNVTVAEWLTKSKKYKHMYKLYRTGVDFGQFPALDVPPYILGLWLGDGHSEGSTLTTMDDELALAWSNFCGERGLEITIRNNGSKANSYRISQGEEYPRPHLNNVLNSLRKLNVIKNKHIPHDYLVASREDRLSLLAGLLDTDGSYDNGCFDFIQKRQILAEQAAFLSRSLGFAAYVTPCTKASQNGTEGTYYRVSISGDLQGIPTRLAHKQAGVRQQKKSVLRTGFSVELLPEDDYFGFEVDCDHLYLMGDFTVTHNSGKSPDGMTLANVSPSSYLATSQRMLQDQYARDFVKISMEKVYQLVPMPEEDAEVEALRLWFKDSVKKAAKGSLEGVTSQITGLWSEAQAANLETQIQFMNQNRDATILLKGKSNYSCQRYGTAFGPEFNCANAPCMTEPNQAIGKLIKAQCVSRGVCPYFIERTRATLAKKTLVNFSNLILLSMFRIFKRRSLLIVDECHQLESTLFGFVDMEISERGLSPILTSLTMEQRELLKEGIETEDDLLAFLQGVILPAVRQRLAFLESGGQGSVDKDDAVEEEEVDEDNEYQQLTKLNYKIAFILELVDDGGSVVLIPNLVESKLNFTKKVQEGYKLKPLSVAQLFNKVFAPGRQVLLMSATILDHKAFCRTLGIPLEEVEFIQVPSTFPKENHQILYRPIGSMGFRDIGRTLPLIGAEIKRLLEKHKNDKGLIHTVNFTPITSFLYEYLGGKSNTRLLFHTPDADKFDLIRQHMASKEPTILIGPSFTEGLDLIDDLSRFQILCKMPYLSMADPVVKKRMTLDPAWYNWVCALSLVQACGRSVRSETDHATSYLLDSNFENFWKHNRHILPAHFRSQVMWDD